MKLKKFVSLGLAAAMMTSILAACGGSEAAKESQTKAPETKAAATQTAAQAAPTEAKEESKGITLPLAEALEYEGLCLVVNEEYPLNENLAWNAIWDRANMKYEITEIAATEATEKGNLVMSGGTYPDFLYKMAALDLDKYGQEGSLIPLEDMIREYAPNLTALLNEKDAWSVITAPDGHIYSLPMIEANLAYGTSFLWWINKVWMENVGITELPTNIDELHTLLKAFKDQDANGNGDPNDEVVMSFDSNLYKFLLHYIGDAKMVSYSTNLAIDDGQIVFWPTRDEYKEFLQEMTKWYEEGLFDETVFTQTNTQFKALAGGQELGFYPNTLPAAPDAGLGNYIQLMPFNRENWTRSFGMHKGGLAITDKCENPEVLIAAFDWLYSVEGGLVARLGIENTNWMRQADGTIKTGLGEFKSSYMYQLFGKAAVPALIPNDYYANVDYTGNPKKISETSSYQEGGIYTFGPVVKDFEYTVEEKENLSYISTDLNGYVDNYAAEVITGKTKLEDTWETFQETLKRMGVEELVNVNQTVFDRMYPNGI